MAGLRGHMKRHDESSYLACEVCNKRFATKSALERHGRTHTGEKPFACDEVKHLLNLLVRNWYTEAYASYHTRWFNALQEKRWDVIDIILSIQFFLCYFSVANALMTPLFWGAIDLPNTQGVTRTTILYEKGPELDRTGCSSIIHPEATFL